MEDITDISTNSDKSILDLSRVRMNLEAHKRGTMRGSKHIFLKSY